MNRILKHGGIKALGAQPFSFSSNSSIALSSLCVDIKTI